MDRREFFVRGSIALAGLAGATSLHSAVGEPKGLTEFIEVKTANGLLRGQRQGDLVTFKGIPYAGSIAGLNRFKAAPPLQPWTGVRDALRLGAPACQPDKTYFGIDEPAPDENCLFLNVWTPAADARKRAVMFYNHGGGFSVGSGGSVYQDGGNLARTYDVVVVATNHRLSMLGYLFLGDIAGEEYATSGNQGLLDIRDGLKWVHENIPAFGGDPSNVMIFGESGGGAKTSCLYAMPSAESFFNKASIESGPGIRMTPRDVATETTKMTLTELGLSTSEWRKLLDVPVDKLFAVQAALAKKGRGPLTMSGGRKGIGGGGQPGGFSPVIDGTVLPHHPFDPEAPSISKNKPLIVGSNRDETAFFFFQSKNTAVFELTDVSLKTRLDQELGPHADAVLATYRKSRPNASATDLYIAITTARMIWIGSFTIAERKYAQNGSPVYMYMFTHESNFIIPGTHHQLGAAHALEIPYKFENIRFLDSQPEAGVQQPGSHLGMGSIVGTDPNREKVADNMSEMWTTFAKTGHPQAKGQPDWPAYTTGERATMSIDAECKIVDDPFGEERKLWESIS
jgi:para-nitrobenzyl esterase